MFNIFKKLQKRDPGSIRVETDTYCFDVDNRMNITGLTYKGAALANLICFRDPMPEGLGKRFQETYLEAREAAFNSLTDAVYDLSHEAKKKQTTVFASTRTTIEGNKTRIAFVITVTGDDLTIQARATSTYKSYWGMTATLAAAEGVEVRKAESNDLPRAKKSHYEATKSFVIETERVKALLSTTYGHAEQKDGKSLSLMPSLEGSDRSVVRGWKVTPDIANYNVIAIAAKTKS